METFFFFCTSQTNVLPKDETVFTKDPIILTDVRGGLQPQVAARTQDLKRAK